MDITSLQNPRVKNLVKLREDKKQRQHDKLIVVEGFDELTLALRCGFKPVTLLFAPELASQPQTLPHVETELITVSRAVFEKISYRDHPDGWMAVFPMPSPTLADLKLSETPLVLLTEAIEKPGNLGAILRTADAVRVDAVLVCDPRVDLWNPNVIRASRGAVFAVPVVEVKSSEALTWLRSRAMRILAATPSAQRSYFEVNLKEPLAIAVGTEDEGLTDFWMDNADLRIQIPMYGRVNSLNVSVSAALALYEVVRQRTA
ncbi:MAG: RNA methyltransferase [Chloroflexi bacterium]|nr:RNA methyltransferase [Chloroflexota bacterium]